MRQRSLSPWNRPPPRRICGGSPPWATLRYSATTATTKRSIIRDTPNPAARPGSSSIATWSITRGCRSSPTTTLYTTMRCGGVSILTRAFAPRSRCCTSISPNKFCRPPVRCPRSGRCLGRPRSSAPQPPSRKHPTPPRLAFTCSPTEPARLP